MPWRIEPKIVYMVPGRPIRAFAFDSGVTITFLSAAAGCSGADFRKEYYV